MTKNTETTGDIGKRYDVLVLGAGIIGVSTAWHLQKRGKKTALLDRVAPGLGASYGNAGLIERSSVIPYAFPRRLCELFRYAGNRRASMRYDWAYLPRISPWLYRFWQHSSPEKLKQAAGAMLPLIERCISEHETMIVASGMQELRREQGWIEIFRKNKVFEHAKRRALEVLAPYHLNFEVLDWKTLQQREPALKSPLAGAIHWLDPHTVTAPDTLVQGYCQNFIAQGGAYWQGDAKFLQKQEPYWQLRLAGCRIEAEHVVVALGWESANFLRQFSKYSVPLAVKRGYHMHYQSEGGQGINHPLCDSAAGFVLAPMQKGLRLTTGVEFADPVDPANDIQLCRAEKIARRYCALGTRLEKKVWLGRRPCLPDMRPVIGKVGDVRGLWVNFGHAHHGLTLGPVSGRLLAEIMSGEAPFTSPALFSPDRFR